MINEAKAHLEAAELLYQQPHYRDTVSRASYAAFSAMQAFVGDPPRGRGEHPGRRGAFVAEWAEQGLPMDMGRALRKSLRYLPDAREVADDREDAVAVSAAVDAPAIARAV